MTSPIKSAAQGDNLRLKLLAPVSVAGSIAGWMLLFVSLTPSLIPRTSMAQGVVGGISFVGGYGIVGLARWCWDLLELPAPKWRLFTWSQMHGGALIALLAIALWLGLGWQNALRLRMGLQPLTATWSLGVVLWGTVVFAGSLLLGRIAVWTAARLSALGQKWLAPRLAGVIGVAGTVLLLLALLNGVVARAILRSLDTTYSQLDALIQPDTPPPGDAVRSGSAQSLLEWRSLGRMGRQFVASGPSADEISALSGGPAIKPARVYVGLGTEGGGVQRAKVALEELKRVGAFSRKALVIVTPTGTGWIDPAAIDTIEYLFRGNIASVAVQYSYFSSPVSLLVEPDSGRESARALFREVHAFWRTLPKSARPRLYLQGLSLGALNSERSVELFEVLGDPPDGALWSGPPYSTPQWRALTRGRNAGSPVWRPTFRDGAFARFMNQDGSTVPTAAPWSSMRAVYLQYASDAVTFYEHRAFVREPELLLPPRAPDISPNVRWYPLVSGLQLAYDMVLAQESPMGFGHVYAPSHYIDAWLEVTGLGDWSPAAAEQLKKQLDLRRRSSLLDARGSG